MRADFLDLFAEFFKNGTLNACIKENFICLIQKKKAATFVKDYRPIRLITSIYKIITKVLAKRLKLVMPSIVCFSQCAFLGGRQITDFCPCC